MSESKEYVPEFRHVAPEAKSVSVTGEWSPEPVELLKTDAGLWTAPATSLAPGAHVYSVTVDGQPSPASTARIVHVPSPGHAQYSASVPHGSVHVRRYASKALGVERECWIYTPPGYEAGTDKYPFLVLQHAGADTQKTWVAKGNVDWLLDDLIAAGRAKPMIVLMIDGHPRGEPVYFKADTRVAAMNDLKHELFDDAIPLVDAEFRTETARHLRGLAGPSVGGGQLISIGLSNLDRFAWIGVFSAGHAIPEFYLPALDDPAKVNEQLKLFWIACSTEDAEFKNNEKFIAILKEKGVNHEWYATPGAHNWPVWRRDLTEYLCRVFQTGTTKP